MAYEAEVKRPYQLKAITSLEQLRAIHRHSVTAPTLPAFLQSLSQAGQE